MSSVGSLPLDPRYRSVNSSRAAAASDADVDAALADPEAAAAEPEAAVADDAASPAFVVDMPA